MSSRAVAADWLATLLERRPPIFFLLLLDYGKEFKEVESFFFFYSNLRWLLMSY